MKFYNQTNQQPNKTKQTENNMKTNARILLLGVITACLFILGVARAQTTIYWSENWENPADQNNWGNLYATWQIGVPTYGPPINSLLRVQDQVRNMAPIPHAHHNVRPKPAVVPFLFQGRFEMYRVNVHADFAQTPAQKIALHRQAARRWWIVEQHKHLHVFSSSNAVRITAACAESKHRKPSSRGVLRASQLSAPYP